MAKHHGSLVFCAGRLGAFLCVVLLVSDHVAARFKHHHNTSELGGESSYMIYLGPWTPCEPLPDHEPAPSSLDRAAEKAGAPGRHAGRPRARDPRPPDAAGRPRARSLVHVPRVGNQRRQIECKNSAGRFVENMYCGVLLSSVPTARVCEVRTDCALGEWSAWRARPDGGHVRTRSVLTLPQGGGAECEVVEEVRPLAPEPGAHWAPSAWGPCQVAGVAPPPAATTQGNYIPEGEMVIEIFEESDRVARPWSPGGSAAGGGGSGPCGGGAQRREVTCVRADGRALHPAHCEALPSPALQQPCEVACPRDCSVGEWSEWSPCRPLGGCPMYPVQELTTAGYSVRRRRVVTAASDSGAACPALEETRPCSAPRCAAWHAQPWSACALSTPHDARSSPCGAGRRTRELRCLDHDMKEAPRSWCSGSSTPLARSEHCRIACPGDCVLSAWGAWGACSASCMAPGRAPPSRVRRRYVLAHAAPDAWQCPPESQLFQTEPCNVHSCSSHSWLALSWAPCTPLNHKPSSADDINNFREADESFDAGDDGLTCLIAGEKTRDVSCVQDNDRIVKDSLCAPLMKPVVRRTCHLRCHRTCSTEPWSEWSPCPNTCQPAIQARERAVWGGPECGARQERRVCTPPRSCYAPRAPAWATAAWGACRLPPAYSCGDGLRIRAIWCSLESHRVDASACAGRATPPAVEPCRVLCPYEIDFTQLANSQRITATGNNTCDQICNDPLRYMDLSSPAVTECKCIKYYVEIMPLESDCILPQGSHCGVGHKIRAALCHGPQGKVLQMDICRKNLPWPVAGGRPKNYYSYDEELPGMVRHDCSVPCPRDCGAGPWSEWGPCTREQDSLAAFRIRTRAVLYEAQHGGRACGPTLQRAGCVRREAVWRAADWGACTPAEAPCGGAVQNRTVRCVLLENGSEVEASSCAGEPPARQAACRAPCPADCVVSQWSDWSPCEQHKTSGRRDRTRVILRAPTAEGAACPHLVEAEPCTARTYLSYATPWDDCQPLGGSPCGEGTKRRIVRCLRDDGVFVNDTFCPNATSTVSWCYVPCGADCELTEWGTWDTSVCTCGITMKTEKFMTRTRRRISGAAWPGRACGPEQQRAPCPRGPCLRLVARQLLGCRMQLAKGLVSTESEPRVCGHGVTATVARCELAPEEARPGHYPDESDESDEAVPGLSEPWRCAPVLPGRIISTPPQQKEQPCAMACGCASEPGTLSEWGPWWPCHANVTSRTRQVLLRPRPQCPPPERYVTIEWSNCTKPGNVFLTSYRPAKGRHPGGRSEDEGWWKDAPPEINAINLEDDDGGTFWVNVSVWAVGLFVGIYAFWAPFHFCYRGRNTNKEKEIEQV